MPAELATTLTLTDDERLLAAEATVRAYCGWHIAPVRTQTITIRDDRELVVLPSMRVQNVSVVDWLGGPVNPNWWSVDEAGLFWRWLPGSRSTYPDGPAFPNAYRGTLTVTFDSGYDAAPADVTAAVVGLAQRSKANPTGLGSATRGPFAESYASSLFGTDKAVLDRYKLPARL